MEDSGAEGLAQEILEKNFNVCPRNCSYDSVLKNVAICPCLKSLLEVKVKRFRLITLTKEISKHPP